jgi:hypothetical protein
VHDSHGSTEGYKTLLYDKFDLTSIPADWIKSDEIISNIHTCIFKLEQGYRDKQDIDEAYNDICNNIKKDMYDKMLK